MFEYLDMPVDIHPGDARADRPARRRAARRRLVPLRPDDDTWTLAGVDLDVPAGTRTAIVGETGSGKTTLGYLVARLYDAGARRDPDRRRRRARPHASTALADTVGVVSQETYLFHASVRENLRFARPDATDEEIEEAARAAQVHEVVAALPDGYDTVVGERGFRFSGGEKQRIAIARTILRNPPVLVLDEATSALDVQTERAVEEALERLAEGRTTIVIAHRLSTVRDADQIVVLDAGRRRRARHARRAARRAAGATRRWSRATPRRSPPEARSYVRRGAYPAAHAPAYGGGDAPPHRQPSLRCRALRPCSSRSAARRRPSG